MEAPILSISILISNRPDTVAKCLQSVEPILKDVPSELILTDTGCGSEVRQIIESYENARIFDFEWCKDFSKARNVGLKNACGKWFLFLDDDEWFEDVSEIVQFFNSDEYLEYTSAYYQQRNYKDYFGKNYSDFGVRRMFQIEKGREFEHAVHEQPPFIEGRTKVLGAYVHHFGYIFSSKEEECKHWARNDEILKLEYEKDNYDKRVVMQYAVHLASRNEGLKIIEICSKIVDRGIEKRNVLYNILLTTIINELYKLRRYDRVMFYLEKAKQMELDPVSESMIDSICSQMMYDTGEYDNSVLYAKKYINSYKNMSRDVYCIYSSPISVGLFNKETYCKVIQKSIAASLNIDVDFPVQQLLDSCTSEEFGEDYSFVSSELIYEAVNHYHDVKKRQLCKGIIEEIIKNYDVETEISQLIYNRTNTSKELEIFCEVEGPCVAAIIAKQIHYSNECVLDEQKLSNDELKFLWDRAIGTHAFISKYGLTSVLHYYADQIRDYVANISFVEWDGVVKQIIKRSSKYSIDPVVDFFSKIASDDERLLAVEYHKGAFYYNNRELYGAMEYDSRIENILSFANVCKDRIINFYAPRIISRYEEYLSEVDTVGMLVSEVVDAVNNKEFSLALKKVKRGIDLAKANPLCLKDVVMWVDESERVNALPIEVQNMVMDIKQKIKVLRETKEFIAAEQAENMLKSFIYGDRNV